MGRLYPCVYCTEDGYCKKYSDDGVTSWCVQGPCKDEKPSNADRFRTMSIDELENILLLEICELTGKAEYEDDGIYKRAPLDCPGDCQICLHDWLTQEATDDP